MTKFELDRTGYRADAARAKAASGGSGRIERDQVERLRALGYVTVDEPKAGGPDAPDAP